MVERSLRRRFSALFLVMIPTILLTAVPLMHKENLMMKSSRTSTWESERSKSLLILAQQPAAQPELDLVLQDFIKNAVPDSSGDFAIIRNFVTGDIPITTSFDVTLATQCDFHALHKTWELLNDWKGPMSLTVFLIKPADISMALSKIIVLRACFKAIAENATFHLVYPNRDYGLDGNSNRSSQASSSPQTEPASPIDCDLIRDSKSSTKLAPIKNYALGVPFPQNLLRNVARQSVKTEFVLLADADLVLSSGVKEGFLRMIRAKTSNTQSITPEKVAYVLPVFETRNVAHIPKTKSELLASWKSGDTRMFWGAICGWCQGQTDYPRWLKSPQSRDMASLYRLNFTRGWEPFFIGDSSIMPMYEERFRQHGFNRYSQVCEMHVAGFSFDVLNNGFAVHKGWKIPGEFHATKGLELDKNQKLYDLFGQELKIRYPTSGRTCL